MFILVYDDLDEKLGSYFYDCAMEIKGLLPQQFQNTLIEIFGERLNMANIDLQLQKANQTGYIFAAYSHGKPSSLVCRNVTYLESGLNSSFCINGLIYSNACSIGQILGKQIVEDGAKAFVGYNEDAEAILAESFRRASIRCDNYALILFLNGYPLKVAVEKAKAFYSKMIDKTYKVNPLIAASLVKNRDALVLIGDEELTIDFCET